MPDEVKEITKTETTEVVDAPGMTSSGVKSLSSMFDRIQEGKQDGKTAREVIAEQPKVVEKPEEKKDLKTEVKTETKEAPKAEEKKEEPKTEEKKVEEDSREALRKAFDEKKAEKEEKKEEAKKEDEVPEEELKVLPQDKPKTAKRIQALLKKIEGINSEVAKTKTEAQEKATKLAELEKKLSEVKTVDPTTDEKVKAQLDELAMLRRRYELDKDPEVKTKFDGRVEEAENNIVKVLKGRQASDNLLKLISDEGGWAKFAGSARTVTVGEEQLTHAELAERILQALPLPERQQVQAAMMEQIQTKRDRERYFKEQQDKAVEYFKSKEEEGTKRAQEYEKQVGEARKAIDEFVARTQQAEWLKDKEIPANATPSEKAAAEEFNRYNNQLRGALKKAVGAKELPELFEVITDSVRYYDERRTSQNLRKEVERLQSELKAKQLEINKFKGAGRSVPKAGSIAATSSDNEEREESPRDISAAFTRIATHGREAVKSGYRGGDDE